MEMGAVYGIALHDRDFRRGLVAVELERRDGLAGLVGRASGLRRGVVALARRIGGRVGAAPRPVTGEPAGARA